MKSRALPRFWRWDERLPKDEPWPMMDEKGEQVSVLLSIEDDRRRLEELEEIEARRACHEAKAVYDEALPFEQAIAEIEQAE